MPDRAPLYFTAKLGGLFPANRAAENAVAQIKGTVRAVLTGGKANQKRRGLYWKCVQLIVPIINEQHGMTLDDDDLHDIMRDKLKMYDEVTLPSGEKHRKRWSTSNRAMTEPDRAEYLNKCLAIWATWTGIQIETLRTEAQNME